MAADGSSVELILTNAHGLHLRPSSKFVALANRFRAQVLVTVDDGEEGNGKSILDLAARAAEKGARIRIRTVGDDAKDALEALAALVKSGFGELRGE